MGKFCVGCGSKLHLGARFCGKCGTQVEHPKKVASAAKQYEDSPKTVMPEPSPAKAVAVAVNPEPQVQGKKTKSGGVLRLVLATLLVVQTAVVAMLGWPGFLVKERLGATDIVEGMAVLSGMQVDFSGGAYDAKVLKNNKTASVDLDEGAVSAGYDLAFTSIPQGPVALSAPMPEGLTLAEGEVLYLDIGFTMLDGTGEEIMVYDHVKASSQEGWMTAEIIPSGYEGMENNVYMQSARYLRPGYTEKIRFNAQFKVKLVHASQSERFNLIFDKSRQIATSLPKNAMEETLSRLEQVFLRMKDFGFNVDKRTEWPMDVFVTTLKIDSKKGTKVYGQYVSSPWGINKGYVNLSRLLFISYNLDHITSVFGHEFMHYIQECYVSSQYKRSGWLDEATATFFEKYFGGITDHGSRQYQLYEGILPASYTPEEGYVRAALVSYWAHKGGWLEGEDPDTGIDKMAGLIKLYSSGGYLQESRWLESINDSVGDPSQYALDFFTRMVLTHHSVWAEAAYKPYILHSQIINKADKDIEKFTSELKLLWDLLNSEEGQISSVKVPGFGARVVALSMDRDGRYMLKEDGTLSVTAQGGETLVLIRSLSAKSEAIKGITVSAPKFRKTLEDKYRYLLLVVNPTPEEKTISYKLTGEANFQEPGKDDSTVEQVPFSGTYKGFLKNLQDGASEWDPDDHAITAVVTFIENKGSLGEYGIRITIDETGYVHREERIPMYIEWSSGKIDGADKLVFSLDGKSFSGTLGDFDGAAIFSVNGSK